MAEYQRPGVFVEESLRTRNPTISSSVSTVVFIAAHGRGPVGPTRVRSFSDFSRTFGGFPARTTILPHSVFEFFNNGGRDAFIIRVLGGGHATSSTSFNDRHETEALATLDVQANSPGAWGDDVRVGIRDVKGDNAYFDLTVYHRGTSNAHIVEQFTGLSMDPDDRRYVESVVNSASAGSSFIRVTDLESDNVNTLGFEGTRPAETEDPVTLDGGDNGDDPTTEEMTNSLDLLDTLSQVHLVNFPGVTSSSVINAALSHVEASGRGFVVIDTPPELDPEGAEMFADSLQPSSCGAVYYPYIHVPDASGSQSSTKLVPPGGAVCGRIAATDTAQGVWKAPAGLSARIAGAVSTEWRLTSDDLDLLTQSHVNPIVHRPGAGFVIWGARTLKKAQADKYIPIRRSLIHIKRALQESTQWAVFEPNDSDLWRSLESTIENYLAGVWQQGGLRGDTPEQAFYVKSDADLNTVENIEAGVVNVEVGVALQYPAEFIIIKLSQWEGGASATDVTA